jgi:hypothetical protein
MKRYLAVLIFVLGFNYSKSQGSVEVIVDPQLEELMKERLERKKNADAKPDTLIVQGYRVQIYFSNDRKKAYAIRDKAIRLYPEYSQEVYVVYQSPNYKVRVGNFIKESDAKSLERLLSKNFENVFLVRDKVRHIKYKQKEVED